MDNKRSYWEHPGLGRLNGGLLFLQKHFRLSVFLGSLLISFLFVNVKSLILDSMNIKVTAHLGQLQKEGVHEGRLFFGDYTRQTDNLIKKGSFLDDGKVLNRYTPVYPLILYGTYRFTKWVGLDLKTGLLMMTALLIALSAIFLSQAAFLFYRHRLFALLAGLLFAAHPYVLQGLTKTMSVTPFMTFLYLGLLLFFILLLRESKKRTLLLLLTGVALGAATLTRPIGLFLPFIFGFLYIVLFRKGRWLERSLGAVAIISGALLTIAPWQAFNFMHGQKILLSSDRVHSMLDGVMFNNSPRKESIQLPEDVNALALRLSTSEVESKGAFIGLVFEELKREPLPVIKLYAIKAARSWYGAFAQQPSKELAKKIISTFYLLLTLFGILKINKTLYRSRVYLMTFFTVSLYFWGMTMLVVSMVRYMIPVFGLMCLFIPAVFGREKQPVLQNLASATVVENGR